MIQFSIDRRNGVLLVEFTGSMTVESLNALDGDLKSFVACEGMMPTVIDFTDISAVEVQVSTLIDRGKSRSLMPGQPRVFVVTDPLLFGLLRLYGTYQDCSGEKSPSIVGSLDEAFATLSLANPKFDQVAIGVEPPRGSSPIATY